MAGGSDSEEAIDLSFSGGLLSQIVSSKLRCNVLHFQVSAFLGSRGEMQGRHLTLVVASGTGMYVIRADEWFLKHSAKCFCGVAVKRAVTLSAPFKALLVG